MSAFHKIAFVFIATAGLTFTSAADTNHAAWKALMEDELVKRQAFLRDMKQQLEKANDLRSRQKLQPMDINVSPRTRMQCEGSKPSEKEAFRS